MAVSSRPVQPRPGRPEWGANAVTALAGLGFGASIALGLIFESRRAIDAPGGIETAAGQLLGLAGSYLLLVMLVLISRLPWLEGVLGQDRLVRWHRRLGPWPIVALGAHAVLITVGYAEQSAIGPWHELGILLRSYPDVLMATVAFGLLVMAGVSLFRAVRLEDARTRPGGPCTCTPIWRSPSPSPTSSPTASRSSATPWRALFWVTIWAATAGVVLVYRVALPIWRTLYHRLRVVEVRQEGPGVVSVICSGRHLERLPVAGGQFLQWRFLRPGMWWQAHPYSLSALPSPPYLRVTVKVARRLLGARSPRCRSAPGWRSKAPTAPSRPTARRGDKVLLVAAGVGRHPDPGPARGPARRVSTSSSCCGRRRPKR